MLPVIKKQTNNHKTYMGSWWRKKLCIDIKLQYPAAVHMVAQWTAVSGSGSLRCSGLLILCKLGQRHWNSFHCLSPFSLPLRVCLSLLDWNPSSTTNNYSIKCCGILFILLNVVETANGVHLNKLRWVKKCFSGCGEKADEFIFILLIESLSPGELVQCWPQQGAKLLIGCREVVHTDKH